MKEEQGFGRPVGGNDVVRDVVTYLCDSEGVVGIDVTYRSRRSSRGPVDLRRELRPDESLRRLLAGGHGWHRKFDIVATFNQAPISRISVSVSRIWTRVHIEGQDRRSVTGERHELVGVLAFAHRVVGAAKFVAAVLFGLAGIASVLLTFHHF
jgi:hypothetical protein